MNLHSIDLFRHFLLASLSTTTFKQSTPWWCYRCIYVHVYNSGTQTLYLEILKGAPPLGLSFLKKRITFWLGRVLGLTNHVMQKKSDLSLKSWVAAPVKMSGFCLSRGSPRILRLHHVYTMYIYMQNQGCPPRFQKFFGFFFYITWLLTPRTLPSREVIKFFKK